jgi:repressor LexA
MSKNLTLRQKEIINFIDSYFKKNNFPPTLKEIGENFKITLKGSFDHIKALHKKGFITYTPKKSRSIGLVKSGIEENDLIEIPLLGTVQAGLPILAYENFETMIKVPANMFGKNEMFALRVRGDSMIDECIKEGDIAIIKSSPIFENGEIIVVDTGNGVTIKKGYKDKDTLRLEAANKNYSTILTKKANILGKLIGILRNY